MMRGQRLPLPNSNLSMSPLGISLLMLAAFAGFGYLAWRKLSIVASLQPEVRWDHPGARLMAVIGNGFLQERMIQRDWKPGLMHAVIFLGFMALLLRKLQLIVIGYYEPFVYPGFAGGLFSAFKDGVEVAVLAALVYAFYRRYVHQAQAARGQPGGAADPVADRRDHDHRFPVRRVSLCAARGSDPAIAHERNYAFVGGRVAAMLRRARAGSARRRVPVLLLGCSSAWCSRSW